MKLMIALASVGLGTGRIKSADAQDYATAITGLPINSLAVMSNEPGFVKLKYSFRTGWQGPDSVSEELTRQFGVSVEPKGLPGYMQWNLGRGRTISINADRMQGALWIILKDQTLRPKPAASLIQREPEPPINRHKTSMVMPVTGTRKPIRNRK